MGILKYLTQTGEALSGGLNELKNTGSGILRYLNQGANSFEQKKQDFYEPVPNKVRTRDVIREATELALPTPTNKADYLQEMAFNTIPFGATSKSVKNVGKEVKPVSKAIESKIKELLKEYDRVEKKGGAFAKDQLAEINDAIKFYMDKANDVFEPLVKEARKYKSAEEFVNKQIPVYHGSRVPLKKFSNKKGGVFFTDEYADATGFAGNPDNVYEGYLNFKKPLVIDAKGAKWDELNTKWGKSTQEIVGNAEKEGYDGVTFKNIVDNIGDTADYGGQSTIHYAIKPEDAFINESQLLDIWNKANQLIPKK